MRCTLCGVDKNLDEFPKGTKASSSTRCRECKNRLSRERTRARWGNTRHYHLSNRYGISAAEVEMLKAAQGGLCAVCGIRAAEHVDHDHSSKRVRGILCESCNGFLGSFNDDPQVLRAAVEYLETER